MKKGKNKKFRMSSICFMNISNNWRKMHHYPLRKKYKEFVTCPCSRLCNTGSCNYPFFC